jgi:hypothetical protein
MSGRDSLPDRPKVPTSSYAQLLARRAYYARNRAALALRQKLYRAGIAPTTAECRQELQGRIA